MPRRTNKATNMTKQGFQFVAAVISTIEDDQTRWAVSDKFADVFAATHSYFNIQLFLKACKGEREQEIRKGK